MRNGILFFGLAAFVVGCTSRGSDVRVYTVAKVTAVAPPAAIAAAPKPSGTWKWTSPKGWKEQAGNDIRLASFVVDAKEGKGDASIVVLGGDAGGLEANVNRWRGQVGLESQSREQIIAGAEDGKSPLGKFQVFEIHGGPGKDSILAAVFSLPNQSLFVKLSGKPEVIKSQKKDFLSLCRSLQENNGAR